MEKIYQVFVSSTFQDLQEERKEVMQALLELDCMPAGMELFPASNDDQWTLIKRVIDTCDYYLLIVGGRYGSTNDKGVSYTQMEFEYALETGKPIISFLPKNPAEIPAGKCESDPEKRKKLEDFKELAKKKLIKYWETPEQLGSVVSRSMIKLIKDFPAEGWVKAGSAVDEKSVQEIARLQKENMELKQCIESVRVSAPSGAEYLQQGEDEIGVIYKICGEDVFGLSTDCNGELCLTWNKIFSVLAPYLIDKSCEHDLIERLNEYAEINQNQFKNYRKLRDCFEEIDRFEITSESFGIILIQLKALGLIQLTDKKKIGSDKRTFWSLTPYGDYMTTQLLALRK